MKALTLGVGRPRSAGLSIAIVLGAMLAVAGAAQAAVVNVSWTAPATNADGSRLTDLSGYRIYIGTSTPSCPGSSYHAVASSTSTPTANQTVSATITGLNAGTSYSVRISAVDRNGNESACSPTVNGVARGALSVSPTGTVSFGSIVLGLLVDRTFTVQNTSGSSLSGSATVGAPFSIVSGGSFSLAAGASQNVVVRFRPTTLGSFAGNVRFTGGGDTISRGVSGSATGSTPPSAPAAPTLTAPSAAADRVSLSWTAVAGATMYQVRRCTVATATVARSCAWYNTSALKYTVSGLKAKTPYDFNVRVRAVNGVYVDTGTYSNTVRKTTL
jgi:hypothetical protein